MRQSLIRRRGVTLAELLITAVILGVLAPSIVLGLSAMRASAASAANRAVARGLASADLERLRLPARYGTLTSGTLANIATPIGAPPMSVVTTLTVSNLGNDQLVTVESRVTWSEVRGGSGASAELRLGTVMRNGAAR